MNLTTHLCTYPSLNVFSWEAGARTSAFDTCSPPSQPFPLRMMSPHGCRAAPIFLVPWERTSALLPLPPAILPSFLYTKNTKTHL